MPTIYWVDQNGEDGGHYLSLSEAMKDARETANQRGYPVEVTKFTCPKLTLKVLLDALNGDGWATESETAAVVNPRGRKR